MTLSVLVPTFERTTYLHRCLEGLASQNRPPDEVVLGLREGDKKTEAFLDGLPQSGLTIRTVRTCLPGVIASMTAACRASTGDIVCLLDDDAEPPPDWLSRIEQRFMERKDLGAVGGRDLLQDHPEWRANEPRTQSVGVLTWYGKLIGNHHRGEGGFQLVDSVKGCNAGFRGDLLRGMGFENSLRGAGAQVHWELALCLDIQNKGYSVGYDPAITVIHHIAPRHATDQIHRGGYSAEGLYDMVWNEHYVIATRTGLRLRTAHLLWALAVGTPDAPGLLRWPGFFLRGGNHFCERISTMLGAIREARKSCASR